MFAMPSTRVNVRRDNRERVGMSAVAIFTRTASRWALALAAATSIGACASLDRFVSDTEPEVVVPESPSDQPDGTPDWVEFAPDALPSTDWVADFGSPQLSMLVSDGLSRNPRVLQALAQFDASLAQRRISRADLYPSLNLNGSASRNEGGAGSFSSSTSYSLGLNASWELDLWGQVRDRVNAAEAGAWASAADLAALRLSIAGQVVNSWLDAIEADLLIDLSDRSIEAQQRVLRITQRRFEAGLVGASDVRLARSTLADFQATRELRLQNRNATLRNLQNLLRLYPDARLDVPDALPRLPVLEGAAGPDWVLARRPDLLAAEARIAQAGFNVDVARKALLPSITLSAGASEETVVREDPTTGETVGSLGDIFDLQEVAYNLAGRLLAPIFQGGRLRAQVEAQRAQLAAQLEAYVQTVLTAYTEVENALDAEARLAARSDALRVSLENARAAEDRLQTRYVEGLATILQLLDAQTRSLNAEGQLIGAEAERLANRVRLHVALGGGRFGEVFPVPEPVPVISAPDLPLLGALESVSSDGLG